MSRLTLKIQDEESEPHRSRQDAGLLDERSSPFDVMPGSVRTVSLEVNDDRLEQAWQNLLTEGRARKAAASIQHALSAQEIEELAAEVFHTYAAQSFHQGIRIPDAFLTRLVGELSGLGPLLELIAQPDVEDIAINLQHIYAYTTRSGWAHVQQAPPGLGDAIRVLMDRAGQRTPTPDLPIADAMLQVMVPNAKGEVERKGLRVNYIMPPASPYGDVITLRVSRYGVREESRLAQLCVSRLPPVDRPGFQPIEFPVGDGLLTPEAANYLLSVMVHGGTMIVAGTTGSGKTYVAQRILQEMLHFFPRGFIRLFVIEDANELVLNGWSGDPEDDTGNVVYTVTRSEVQGGPPPVTMYDLIRAALRARPHGIIIGESRGAEAWELVRAAATGHGFSAFTLHATGAEHVWSRFYQVIQAHPDARRLDPHQIAQGFAEAVCTVIYLERSPVEGQLVREISEVSPVVERAAGRPALLPLFYRAPGDILKPTGNRPTRPGYRPEDLHLPANFFLP